MKIIKLRPETAVVIFSICLLVIGLASGLWLGKDLERKMWIAELDLCIRGGVANSTRYGGYQIIPDKQWTEKRPVNYIWKNR